MEEDQVYIFICQATAVSRANAVIDQTHAAVMIMCGAERYLSWLAIYQRECVREREETISQRTFDGFQRIKCERTCPCIHDSELR